MRWRQTIGCCTLCVLCIAPPALAYQRLYNKADRHFAISVADITVDAQDPACALDLKSQVAPFDTAFVLWSERTGGSIAVQPIAMGRLLTRQGSIRIIDVNPDDPADIVMSDAVISARIDDVFPTRDYASMQIHFAMPDDGPPRLPFGQLDAGIGFAIEVPLDQGGKRSVVPFEGPLVAEAIDVFLACIDARAGASRL